jgi:hypothetical protein
MDLRRLSFELSQEMDYRQWSNSCLEGCAAVAAKCPSEYGCVEQKDVCHDIAIDSSSDYPNAGLPGLLVWILMR